MTNKNTRLSYDEFMRRHESEIGQDDDFHFADGNLASGPPLRLPILIEQVSRCEHVQRLRTAARQDDTEEYRNLLHQLVHAMETDSPGGMFVPPRRRPGRPSSQHGADTYAAWISLGRPSLHKNRLARQVYGADFDNAPTEVRKRWVERCRARVNRYLGKPAKTHEISQETRPVGPETAPTKHEGQLGRWEPSEWEVSESEPLPTGHPPIPARVLWKEVRRCWLVRLLRAAGQENCPDAFSFLLRRWLCHLDANAPVGLLLPSPGKAGRTAPPVSLTHFKWLLLGQPSLYQNKLAWAIYGAQFTRASSGERKQMVDRCRQ